MIGKVPRAGSGFRGLVSYLMHGKKDTPDPNRVAWTATRNLLVDDAELAPRLMRAVAKQSVRCKRPVYHLVISWHHQENPTDELMRLVGDTTISDLDLGEHQAILIAHKDTAHRHLHVVVNRVHPDTGKAWHPGMDYARIEKSLRRQAEALDIPYVPGRFNDPEKFQHVTKAVRDSEFQAAVRHDKPLPKDRWSLEEIRSRRLQLAPIIEDARTWQQLAIGLAEQGLRIEPKGQGAVIADDFGFMKLSDLGKDVRLKELESAFGESFKDWTARAARDPELTNAVTVEPVIRFEPVVVPAAPTPAMPAPVDTDDGGPGDVIVKPTPLPKDTSLDKQSKADAEAREKHWTELEKERLREAFRAERAAAYRRSLETPLVAATPVEAEAKPQDTSTPTTRSDTVATNTALSNAKAKLIDAFAARDITKTLENVGLASEGEIKRANDEIARAKDDVARHQSLAEWMEDQVGDALTEKTPPKRSEPPASERDDEHEQDDERDI